MKTKRTYWMWATVLSAAAGLVAAMTGCDYGTATDEQEIVSQTAGAVTWTVEVYDEAGNPLEGARVSVGGETVTTDSEGSATLQGMMVGETRFAVEAAGYLPQLAPDLVVPEGGTTMVDLFADTEFMTPPSEGRVSQTEGLPVSSFEYKVNLEEEPENEMATHKAYKEPPGPCPPPDGGDGTVGGPAPKPGPGPDPEL